MADESIMKALDKVLSTYKAGGEYSKQRATQLKGEERRYTAGAQQGLVSRGLSGTTVAASIPSAFEQEIAAPYRTETERLRSGAEMQGLMAKAGFLESATQREFAAGQQKSEQDAAMARLTKQIAANRPSKARATGNLGTFASREAARRSELSARDASTGSGGTSQHTGGATGRNSGFDIGNFDFYSEPTFDQAGGDFNATLAPAGGGGDWDFAAPTMDTLAEGGIMAGGAPSAGADQATSLEDLAKLAEQWMGPEGGEGQTTAEFPEWDELRKKAYNVGPNGRRNFSDGSYRL
jgi:hypothetical protein